MATDYYSRELPAKLKLWEDEVYNTYGQHVSIARKNKSLTKFGNNPDLDTGVTETIWTNGGDENYRTGNTIDSVVSDNAADTQTVVIEGHQVDSDGNFSFLTQNVVLNGTTPVDLLIPFARTARMYNISATELQGEVLAYDDTAGTNHLNIAAGQQQSRKCATTFSNVDYFCLTNVQAAVRRANSATADIFLEIRQKGGVFRDTYVSAAGQAGGPTLITFDPPLIVPNNADVRVRAVANSNNNSLSASFSGYLASVVS